MSGTVFDGTFARVIQKFASAAVTTSPFPHLVVGDVFEPSFYQNLIDNIPSTEQLARCRTPDGGISASRSIVDVQSLRSPFWYEFAQYFGSGDFVESVLQRFRNQFDVDYYVTTQLVQDRIGYRIGPHTDIVSKVMTILFYLPRDATHQRFGTSICTTIDPALIGTENHHAWDQFEVSHLVLFRPNTALAFCRTDDSFHAVSTVDKDVIRNTITVTVRQK